MFIVCSSIRASPLALAFLSSMGSGAQSPGRIGLLLHLMFKKSLNYCLPVPTSKWMGVNSSP